MVGHIHIMGILNLTPDSFYAGSRVGADDFLRRFTQMFQDGADVVDLGACSTRPGSAQPSLEEEWSRLEPALEEMAGYALPGDSVPLRSTPAPPTAFGSGPLPLPLSGGGQAPGRAYPAISLDTYRSEIVRRAYDIIGPVMVNDISAGALDPDMLATVAQLNLPYVAMHMRGTPENMQQYTDYQDIVQDLNTYFQAFDARARQAGLRDWILDPGFGFSKTLDQNWELLHRLHELDPMGHQILVGLSRKSMIYKKLGITPEEAMPATQVAHFAALERGASWLRVHDVAPAVQTARLYSTMYTSSPGAAK